MLQSITGENILLKPSLWFHNDRLKKTCLLKAPDKLCTSCKYCPQQLPHDVMLSFIRLWKDTNSRSNFTGDFLRKFAKKSVNKYALTFPCGPESRMLRKSRTDLAVSSPCNSHLCHFLIYIRPPSLM